MCSGQFFPQEAYAPVVLAEALHVRKDLIHAGLRQQWVAVKNRDERKIGLWVVEPGEEEPPGSDLWGPRA